MEKVETIAILIHKSREGALSPEEQERLDSWLSASEENRALFAALSDQEVLFEKLKVFEVLDTGELWTRTQRKIAGEVPVIPMVPARKSRKWQYAAAAAAIIIIAGGVWYSAQLGKEEPAVTQQKAPDESNNELIVPGSQQATLTLADGRAIALNDAGGDQPIREGGIQIGLAAGEVFYNQGTHPTSGQGTANGSKVLYNIVSTPKGGQYRVILPDGSIVTLNAASSLRFPIAFAGSERNVSLTGEAFFEVRHMDGKPFKVTVNRGTADGGQIEVLGTHFNVNGYGDDALVKTTLLEGSVKYTVNKSVQLLKPGQQVGLDGAGKLLLNKKADTSSIVSWKNNLFTFKGANLQGVMKEIERWYNVTVVFSGKIPEKSFDGQIPRSSTLNNLLNVLRANGINVVLDQKQRKVTITS